MIKGVTYGFKSKIKIAYVDFFNITALKVLEVSTSISETLFLVLILKMDKSDEYETIVIGLGAMGSAALYQLAKKKVKCLGIDQFVPPHTQGSSHGDSRIYRYAIGEGSVYVAFSLRSYEIFRELEKETNKSLLNACGGLILSSKGKDMKYMGGDFYGTTVKAAQEYNIKHEILDSKELKLRFPQFNVEDDEYAYYEPNAGYLLPEECIAAQLEMAKKYGANLNCNEKFLSFEDLKTGGVLVQTNKGTYKAKTIIITVGAWLPSLLSEKYSKLFSVVRVVVSWWQIKESFDQNMFSPSTMPVFIWETGPEISKFMYGSPCIHPGGGVKIGFDEMIDTTPEIIDRTVSEEEKKKIYSEQIEPYFKGLNNQCVKAMTCMFTCTPDRHFVIDWHPEHQNKVLLASPCSGHGFKHSAAIGETLAELVTLGKSSLDISKFSFKRFEDMSLKKNL